MSQADRTSLKDQIVGIWLDIFLTENCRERYFKIIKRPPVEQAIVLQDLLTYLYRLNLHETGRRPNKHLEAIRGLLRGAVFQILGKNDRDVVDQLETKILEIYHDSVENRLDDKSEEELELRYLLSVSDLWKIVQRWGMKSTPEDEIFERDHDFICAMNCMIDRWDAEQASWRDPTQLLDVSTLKKPNSYGQVYDHYGNMSDVRAHPS